MVICFECSRETKEQLDELLAGGGFKDTSEAIAIAVANQLLLTRSAPQTPIVLPARRAPSDARVAPAPNTIASLPSIFLLQRDLVASPVAPFIEKLDSPARDVSLSQSVWIFGQHNKLLPAKASCRALANLLVKSPSGVNIQDSARLIAVEASELALYLAALDDRFKRQRDEALSVAFPRPSDPDKGRIRYANQFVAGVTKQGVLTGLLADLQLVNKLPKADTVALTEAGWQFALLPNPVLDGQDGNPEAKFSGDERSFLIRHITTHVPVERSAYIQVLNVIHDGNDTPEMLQKAFAKLEKESAKTRLFFSTQRSGALSRMADLNLIRRVRDGVRAKYEITEYGVAFLNG